MYMIWDVTLLANPIAVELTIVDLKSGMEPLYVKVRPEFLEFWEHGWLPCKDLRVDGLWLEAFTDFKPRTPSMACECGAEKSGAWGHFAWCPKYTKR